MANASWTEAQLIHLARNNYYQHDGQTINMQGRHVADIMPFGLANVGIDFEGIGGGGANPQQDQGQGAGDVFDEDFGDIRVGAAVPGGILGELNPNRFGNVPEEEVIAEGLLFGGLEESPPEEVPPPQPNFDDPELDIGALLDDVNGGNIQDLGGRQINYANIRRMRNLSFGFRRRRFFYEQVRRMREEFVANIGKYSAYQFSATFSGKKSNAEYAQSVAVDFGTTQVDGETRRVPYDITKWDFDIHDRLWGMNQPDFQSAEGELVRIDNEGDVDLGIQRMIDTLEAALPAEGDSNSLNFSDTTLHLSNLFIFKFLRRRAGGPGVREDISGKTGEYSFSRKSVYTPIKNARNLCFWDSLAVFLFNRYEEDGVERGWYIEAKMRSVIEKIRTTKSQRAGIVRRFAIQEAGNLRDFYARVSERDPYSLSPIQMNEIPDILSFFQCDDTLIMNVDGEALLGDIENAETRELKNNQYTIIWFNDHIHLVYSYTGSLVIKKCRRCDVRFATEASLKKHLDSKKCMTCVCLPKGGTFDTEAEWKFHVENRANTCSRYRLLSKEGNESVVDEKGMKLRFLNDKRKSHFNSRKEQRDALEKDYNPIRIYEEAIFFDLESVVPMNKAGIPVNEHESQVPYASGWIERSAALRGEEVNIRYGTDCIKDFVDWLDVKYDEILLDEEQLWFRRASEGVLAEPKPKMVKGFENYARRVKKSWDYMVDRGDIEQCPYCNYPIATEHGYEEMGEETLSFSNCALRAYAKNAADLNIKTNFNGNAPRIAIWAHNGGKYDWVFLHRYMMEAGRLNDISTVRCSSKYFQISYRGVFEFKDSMNFVMGSLDTLGKNFGVETLKGIFPYRLLSNVETIDKVFSGENEIREMIPHEYIQIYEKIKGPMGASIKRDINEEEYVEFFASRNWVYDVRKETDMYLRDDVLCLFQVMEKFKQGWKEMPKEPKLFEYCTIGQMCHTYFLKNFLGEGLYPCLDTCEDAYIRKALYGGRTEVFRRLAPDGKKIHYVDVNSLYPYVMEDRDLPCGDPTWYFLNGDHEMFQFVTSAFPIRTKICKPEHFAEIVDQLNNGLNGEKMYGFFKVDMVCNLETTYPVLPERRSTDEGKTFKNMFTNMAKKEMVYYSEELKRAIKKGYRITKLYSFCLWSRGRVYGPLIKVLKKQKLLGEGKDINGVPIPGVEKNPSLRAAAKTAQNSLFGKTIQFIDASVQLVHSREGLYKSIERPFSKVSIKPIFRSRMSDVVEVTTKFEIPKVQKRSCAALGTAILAEARLVLYDYFEKVQEIGGEILYCDTDSIVFAGDVSLPDECMHDCEYGKMKVEIDPDTIEEGGFVAMSPKCYSFKLKSGLPYVRCKGVNLSQNLDMVPEERDRMSELIAEMENEELIRDLALPIGESEVVQRGINFDKMRNLILGKVDVLLTSQLQFLKSTDRLVSAYENVKVMRSKFDKRFLLSDGMTVPWNDFNMNMESILSSENVTALSDYLGVVSPIELVHLMEIYRENAFFNSVVASWLDSDNPNVLIYRYMRDSM